MLHHWHWYPLVVKITSGMGAFTKKLLLQTYRFNIKFKKNLNKLFPLFLLVHGTWSSLLLLSILLILMFPITLHSMCVCVFSMELLLSCKIFCQSNTSLYVWWNKIDDDRKFVIMYEKAFNREVTFALPFNRKEIYFFLLLLLALHSPWGYWEAVKNGMKKISTPPNHPQIFSFFLSHFLVLAFFS